MKAHTVPKSVNCRVPLSAAYRVCGVNTESRKARTKKARRSPRAEVGLLANAPAANPDRSASSLADLKYQPLGERLVPE